MSKFRIYSAPTDYGRRSKLAILIEGFDGIIGVIEPLTIRRLDPNVDACSVEPTYTLDRAVQAKDAEGIWHLDGRALMQAFLDHAWDVGMRPTGQADADTTKQVTAMREHLADMQKLIFGPGPNIFTIDRHGGSA